jgi:hypothetical protein
MNGRLSQKRYLDDCLLIEAVDDVDWYSKVIFVGGAAQCDLSPAVATESIRRRRRKTGDRNFTLWESAMLH